MTAVRVRMDLMVTGNLPNVIKVAQMLSAVVNMSDHCNILLSIKQTL